MIRKVLILLFLLIGLTSSAFAVDFVTREIRCIADNVWFEARGEGKEGWDAILTVMQSRIKDKRFPNEYCKVVKQKRKNICQFSWVCDSRLNNSTKHRSTNLYREIYDYCETFYQAPHYFIDEKIDGALYYHSNKVKRTALGKMKLSEPVKVGNHYFYREHQKKASAKNI